MALHQQLRHTWLGALCDFDLQLVRVHHELRRHAKAPARHLQPQVALEQSKLLQDTSAVW